MQVTYKCRNCQKEFVRTFINQKPLFNTQCLCGGNSVKTFKGISMDKEDDNVSHAIEMMKYATNPSGKQKTVI
jgi:hypothetical protein